MGNQSSGFSVVDGRSVNPGSLSQLDGGDVERESDVTQRPSQHLPVQRLSPRRVTFRVYAHAARGRESELLRWLRYRLARRRRASTQLGTTLLLGGLAIALGVGLGLWGWMLRPGGHVELTRVDGSALIFTTAETRVDVALNLETLWDRPRLLYELSWGDYPNNDPPGPDHEWLLVLRGDAILDEPNLIFPREGARWETLKLNAFSEPVMVIRGTAEAHYTRIAGFRDASFVQRSGATTGIFLPGMARGSAVLRELLNEELPPRSDRQWVEPSVAILSADTDVPRSPSHRIEFSDENLVNTSSTYWWISNDALAPEVVVTDALRLQDEHDREFSSGLLLGLGAPLTIDGVLMIVEGIRRRREEATEGTPPPRGAPASA